MEEGEEVVRGQLSGPGAKLSVAEEFDEDFHDLGEGLVHQWQLDYPLAQLSGLKSSQLLWTELQLVLLDLFEEHREGLAGDESQRQSSARAVAGRRSEGQLSEEMAILDGDDFSEASQTVERLSLEQRIVIFLLHLPHDASHKSLNVERPALLRLENDDVFCESAENKQTHFHLPPGLA
jgi:hypothetical protein